MQVTDIKILDQLLLVDLSGIHLWTAKKKLDEKLLEGKLPPEKLATVGTMRIIDHDHLKPFEKIKRQAVKVLEENGVRFLGGYAVPQDKITDVADRLDVLATQFYNLKQNFIHNYDQYVNEWVLTWEKADWRDALRAAIVPKARVAAGMEFGYAACRVSPDGDQRLSTSLGTQVRGLADQLYAEVAETADKLLENGLASRGHVSQTTIKTVRKISSKLSGLMFISRDVQVLTQHIEEVLGQLPKSGIVSGSEYNQIVTLVSSLSQEDSIRRLVKHLNSAQGNAPEAAPEAMFPVAASITEQASPEPEVITEPEPTPVEPSSSPVEMLEQLMSVAPLVSETPSAEKVATIGDLIMRVHELALAEAETLAESEPAPAEEEEAEADNQLATFWF